MAQSRKLTIDIVVEFTGGLEMLFDNQNKHKISIPTTDSDGSPTNIRSLVDYLCKNVMRDSRRELFVVDEAVRPGILVLINDTDWELEGEDKYELVDGDNILFVSTLHGG